MRDLDSNYEEIVAGSQSGLILLYSFKIPQLNGNNFVAAWNYTSHTTAVQLGQLLYTPAAITTDSKIFIDTGKPETESITLQLEPIEPFNTFVGGRFLWTIYCEITEMYVDTNGGQYSSPIMNGAVETIERTTAGLTITIKDKGAWFGKKIPNVQITRRDQRIAYSKWWGVTDNSPFIVDATVVSFSQNEFLCDEVIAAKDSGYYQGGLCVYTRVISGVTVSIKVPIMSSEKIGLGFPINYLQKITLAYTPPAFLDSDNRDVKLYAGYDGTIAQSATKFSNVKVRPNANDSGLVDTGFLGFWMMPVANLSFVNAKECKDIDDVSTPIDEDTYL